MAETKEKYSSFYKLFSGLALLGLMAYALVFIIIGVVISLSTGTTILHTIRGDILILTGLPAYFALAIIGRAMDKAREKLTPPAPPAPPPPPEILDIPENVLLARFDSFQVIVPANPLAWQVLFAKTVEGSVKIVGKQLATTCACTTSNDLKSQRAMLLEKIASLVDSFGQERPTPEACDLAFELCEILYSLPEGSIDGYKPKLYARELMFRLAGYYAQDARRLAKVKKTISDIDPEENILWVLEMLSRSKCLNNNIAQMKEVWIAFLELKSRGKDKLYALEQIIDLRKQLIRWRYALDVRAVMILPNEPAAALSANFLQIDHPICPADAQYLRLLFHSAFFWNPSQATLQPVIDHLDMDAKPIERNSRHKMIAHPGERPKTGKKKGKKNSNGNGQNNRRKQI